MISAQEARNNMKYSLDVILEEINTQIINRSQADCSSVYIYRLPLGTLNEVKNVLVSNGFYVVVDQNNTLAISW